MKPRDRILFGLPLAIGCGVLLFALLFYWQQRLFEASYMQDARRNIEQEAQLVAHIVRPLLDQGKLAEARAFCDSFTSDTLRLSLIDASGKVEADSGERAAILSDHSDRVEIRAAFLGQPTTVERYSESLNQWMIYHALLLPSSHGNYVLRTAVPTDRARQMLVLARQNMALSLLFGGALVFMLTLYILYRVRKPILALQEAATAISSGDLNTSITIPQRGVLRDLAISLGTMTEQLKIQLARVVHERNQKDAIFNAMSEAVMLLLPDGTAIKYNRAAAMLFGLFAPDARFNLVRSGMPDLLAKAHQALKDDTPFESEIVFRRPEGNLLLFVKGYVIHQDEDKLLLLTISDLTQQRRMESFRSDFIANVSHEIKTPLTCIVGAVETLQEEEDISPEARAKLLDILAQQSRRLNLLVQDILSLAALERKQNNRRQNFTEVKLDSTLINAMNLCLPKAEEMQIELLITENMPTSVQGDCQLLEQAVVNLINNALTYSGSPRVELALKQEHGLATISVKDFGIGIAPVHHQRIFERFYLVHQERSRELGGTGLGLAIVKHIAQLHHGYAELESTPGKGCTFKINLPL
ncbi:MAG: hypothetical protein GX945_13365 [Lentisphaerae bacterium]|nr:hypothetical protein [Lentisphaerota bacterium]